MSGLSDTDKLRILREWAEGHPWTGIDDAPTAVKKMLGYKGRGAANVRSRLARRFPEAPHPEERQ